MHILPTPNLSDSTVIYRLNCHCSGIINAGGFVNSLFCLFHGTWFVGVNVNGCLM